MATKKTPKKKSKPSVVHIGRLTLPQRARRERALKGWVTRRKRATRGPLSATTPEQETLIPIVGEQFGWTWGDLLTGKDQPQNAADHEFISAVQDAASLLRGHDINIAVSIQLLEHSAIVGEFVFNRSLAWPWTVADIGAEMYGASRDGIARMYERDGAEAGSRHGVVVLCTQLGLKAIRFTAVESEFEKTIASLTDEERKEAEAMAREIQELADADERREKARARRERQKKQEARDRLTLMRDDFERLFLADERKATKARAKKHK